MILTEMKCINFKNTMLSLELPIAAFLLIYFDYFKNTMLSLEQM